MSVASAVDVRSLAQQSEEDSALGHAAGADMPPDSSFTDRQEHSRGRAVLQEHVSNVELVWDAELVGAAPNGFVNAVGY